MAGNAVAWGLAWGAAGLAVIATLNFGHLLPYQEPLREQLFLASIFGINGALVSIAFSGFVARRYHGRSLTDLRLGRFTFAAATVSALLMPVTSTAVRFALWGHLSFSLQGALISIATGATFGAAAAAVTLRVAQRHRISAEDSAVRLTTGDGFFRIP